MYNCLHLVAGLAARLTTDATGTETPPKHDHFHGVYEIVICPTGKYALCTVLKNGKRVNYYCKPKTTVIEQPLEPMTTEEHVSTEEIELVDDNDDTHKTPGVQEIRFEAPKAEKTRPEPRNYVNERKESPLSNVTTSPVT